MSGCGPADIWPTWIALAAILAVLALIAFGGGPE